MTEDDLTTILECADLTAGELGVGDFPAFVRGTVERDVPALVAEVRRLIDLQRDLSHALATLTRSAYAQPDLETFAAAVEAAMQESRE